MNSIQTADILIIGGGIIGLSLARELKRRGVRNVKILERNSMCGIEASSAAAGMLAPQAEADFADDFFRFCSASRDLYPNFAQELFEETGVDIELDQTGTLYLAFDEHDAEELEKRFEWQAKANLKVEKLTAQEVLEIEPNISRAVHEALFFPNDWQVENRKIISALQKSAELNKIEIYTDSEVKNLLFQQDSPNGSPKIIGAETDERKFFADTIVLATGAWTSLINSRIKLVERDVNFVLLPTVRPIRGQMLCFNPAERLFSKVIYTPRGYLVPRGDYRILIGATVEDVGFDKNLTQSGTDYLRQTAFEISPNLANYEIFDQWAGLRPRAADGLPILGAPPYKFQNLYLATGHFRNGILLAPLTAKILADKIVENVDSKYLENFNMNRLLFIK